MYQSSIEKFISSGTCDLNIKNSVSTRCSRSLENIRKLRKYNQLII